MFRQENLPYENCYVKVSGCYNSAPDGGSNLLAYQHPVLVVFFYMFMFVFVGHMASEERGIHLFFFCVVFCLSGT